MNKKALYFCLLISLLFVGCKSSDVKSKKGNNINKEYTSTELSIDDIFLQACTQKELGNLNEALELYNKVISLNPNYSAAYYEKANVLFQKKEVDNAISSNKKAISINPDNIWYKLQLSQMYVNINDLKSAAKEYDAIIKSYPNVIEYYQELAEIYQKAGDLDNMMKTIDKIEKKWGITEEISMFKFRVFNELKQYDKAEEQIKNLQKAFPNETKYVAIMAETYMNKKDYKNALDCYKKIESINPDDPYINVSLANYYLIQNDKEKTFEYLKKAFSNTDLDYNTKIQVLFTIYGKTVDSNEGDFKKFFELLKNLSTLYPNEQAVWELLSTGYMKTSDFLNAKNAIKKAISLGASKYELYQNLLYAESTLDNPDELIADCEKTIELFPEQPLPYLFYGVNLMFKDQNEDAKKALEQGSKLVVDQKGLLEDFYSNLAEVYYRLNDTINSDKYFEKTLDINPDNYMALNNYAYYLSVRKVNLEKAEKMSKKVVDKFPNEPTYVDTYAWILYEMQKYDEARKAMESIIGSEKDWSAILHEHYGDILLKLNQTEKATEHYQKAKNKK